MCEPTLISIILLEAWYISQELALLLSSTMATTNSRDNRDELFYHVRDLVLELLEHSTLYLNNDDLAAIGIEVVKTGTPADSGQQFCDLYPRNEFDAILKNVIARHSR